MWRVERLNDLRTFQFAHAFLSVLSIAGRRCGVACEIRDLVSLDAVFVCVEIKIVVLSLYVSAWNRCDMRIRVSGEPFIW